MRLHRHRGAAIGLAVALTILSVPVAFAGFETAPPTEAGDDAYTTPEDEALVVGAVEGILANDPPGACVMGYQTTGSVTVAADGSFTYTPPANFNGPATFLYQIAESAPCNFESTTISEAFVTITVTPVNDAPTASPDSFQVLKDRTLNVGAPGVLLNDDDIDDDALTATKVTNAAHGVVILAADGSFSYTPASGYVGPDAFSYRVSDGTAFSPTRVVTLSVTAVPPVPTPTPAPTPTAAPTPTPEITPEPTPSEEPTEPTQTTEPGQSGEATAGATVPPSATPAPTAAPGQAVDGGGIPLPALLLVVLLVLLVGFGAALYGPRWLAAQRGEPIDDDRGP